MGLATRWLDTATGCNEPCSASPQLATPPTPHKKDLTAQSKLAPAVQWLARYEALTANCMLSALFCSTGVQCAAGHHISHACICCRKLSHSAGLLAGLAQQSGCHRRPPLLRLGKHLWQQPSLQHCPAARLFRCNRLRCMRRSHASAGHTSRPDRDRKTGSKAFMTITACVYPCRCQQFSHSIRDATPAGHAGKQRGASGTVCKAFPVAWRCCGGQPCAAPDERRQQLSPGWTAASCV